MSFIRYKRFGNKEIYVTVETHDMTEEIDRGHRKALEKGYDDIARELKADWDYHHADLEKIKFTLDIA
jgi:hypothetical protein